MPDLPILARTLRGLEWIAAAEVQGMLEPRQIERGHRELRFSVPELSGPLQDLGTVDDVFLVVAGLDGVGRARESLQRFAGAAEQIDLDGLAELLGRKAEKTFDVVGSFVGRRNYSRYEIEDALGSAVATATGWSYRSRSGGDPARGTLSLRVHLAGSEATVAVRIAQVPLHRRAYRVASRVGSLHPPLARALALLAGLRPGLSLIDPFCGTGTIAIEAKLACPELHASGSDLDPEAVEAARRNAAAAGVELELGIRDAADLAPADRFATNPPWEEAVTAGGRAESFPRKLQEVVASGARAVVLTPPDGKPSDSVLENRVRVSGAIATICVFGTDSIDEASLFGPALLGAMSTIHSQASL